MAYAYVVRPNVYHQIYNIFSITSVLSWLGSSTCTSISQGPRYGPELPQLTELLGYYHVTSITELNDPFSPAVSHFTTL